MTPVEQLQALRVRALALVESLPAAQQSRSHHADLSPLLWHLGHLLYIEEHWFLERVCATALPRERATLFRADGMPRPQRSRCVPPLHTLEPEIAAWSARLPELIATHASHPLLQADYLLHFLIQHHGQHLETMQQIHLAYQLRHAPAHEPQHAPAPCPVAGIRIRRPAGHALIGTDLHETYDNERPAHEVLLPRFSIALHPVRNGEYVGFLAAGGYQDPKWWTSESWQWRQTYGITAPLGWRQDPAGRWYGIGPEGAHDLDGASPVQGVSAYEAAAFARYAGRRLPTEEEWECAAREGSLEGVGLVWEWCANAFHPYAGFSAFPYRGYSMPWFDGVHRTLRGFSRYTHPSLRRPTFRNFHTPGKRHIFAGLRLCDDG